MGNLMGGSFKGIYDLAVHPDVTPDPDKGPTFEPDLGFKGKRKVREMEATDEEMFSAKIPIEDRDFCAHMLLKFMKCRKEEFPWVVKCAHEKHEYLECKYEDFVIRMKEYERERRLLVLQKQCTQ